MTKYIQLSNDSEFLVKEYNATDKTLIFNWNTSIDLVGVKNVGLNRLFIYPINLIEDSGFTDKCSKVSCNLIGRTLTNQKKEIATTQWSVVAECISLENNLGLCLYSHVYLVSYDEINIKQ